MENLKLKKLEKFSRRDGPLVFIIMDGIGLGRKDENNAFHLANTPFLDKLQAEKKLYVELKAHGTAVGLPTDDEMGNSEVGHNAFGAGIIPRQRALLAKEAVLEKTLFESQKWIDFTSKIKNNNKTLHFIGLLSDGYVHSHISHLIGLLKGARDMGIKNARVHPLLDGRDVPPQSALKYIKDLEGNLKEINESGDFDYKIASGGGRMRVTMDRYNSDWGVVRRGWEAHVCGIPEKFPGYKGYFESATDAINQARTIEPEIIDQYLPSFVVINDNKFPVGKMEDGDGVIYFNFRGDRAIQITRAFDEENFNDFERKCHPNVTYYGLMQYDEIKKIPSNFFLEPPLIGKPFTEYLHSENLPMYAVSETFKIGHLCYFFCGNRDLIIQTETFSKEDNEIRSSKSSLGETITEIVSFKSELIEANPKMRALEIKNDLIKAIVSNKYKFLRVNFTNGDMVGHTGSLTASMIAAETVDQCVKEVAEIVDGLDGICLITADHGNLEDMSPNWKTSHTCNPVMFSILDSDYKNEYSINNQLKEPGLGNVAATILNLLGYEKPSEFMDSLIKFKSN